MTSFAVVRHPDVAVAGVIADESLELHRANGWYRVSDWRPEPGQFHLPDYDDATEDLDATESEDPQAGDEPDDADPTGTPKPKTARKPARTTKKESNA